MAIFIPPRGTDSSLSSITLIEGELVYNTTQKKFFTGDGVTNGGVPVFEDKAQDLSAYATKAEIANLLSGEIDPVFVDVSGHFLSAEKFNEVSGTFAVKSELFTESAADAKYALKADVPSVDGLATEAFVSESVAAASTMFAVKSELFTEAAADAKYALKEDLFSGSYEDLEDKPEIPSIEGLATEMNVSAENEYLLGKIAKLSREVDALKRNADVEVSTFNPKIVKSEDGVFVNSDATADVIISSDDAEIPSTEDTSKKDANGETVVITNASMPKITAKSVDIDDTVIDAGSYNGSANGNAVLFFDVKENLSITNSTIGGDYSAVIYVANGKNQKTTTNTVKAVETEVLKLDGVTFDGHSYNTLMTGQNTTGAYLKYADIINCSFNDTCDHVYIWFAGWQDEAILNIKNCTFNSCEQMLCLADYHGEIGQFENSLTVNIENCEISSYQQNDTKYPEYNGFVYCDSRNVLSGKLGTEEGQKNPFSKITINIKNVTVGGVKLTKDNFLMGTQATGQMMYLYHAAGPTRDIAFNEYTKDLFPTVYVDGELITQLA